MTAVGANVDDLRRLAATFRQKADVLEGDVIPAVTYALSSSPWQGRDADGFRGAWGSALAPRVRASAASLRAQAERLERNANEQQEASHSGVQMGGYAGYAILTPYSLNSRNYAELLPLMDGGDEGAVTVSEHYELSRKKGLKWETETLSQIIDGIYVYLTDPNTPRLFQSNRPIKNISTHAMILDSLLGANIAFEDHKNKLDVYSSAPEWQKNVQAFSYAAPRTIVLGVAQFAGGYIGRYFGGWKGAVAGSVLFGALAEGYADFLGSNTSAIVGGTIDTGRWFLYKGGEMYSYGISEINQNLSGVAEDIHEFSRNLTDGAQDIASSVEAGAREAIRNPESMIEGAKSMAEEAQRGVSSSIDNIKKSLISTFSSEDSFVANVGRGAQHFVRNPGESLRNGAMGFMDGASKLADSGGKFISGIGAGVGEYVENFKRGARSIGR